MRFTFSCLTRNRNCRQTHSECHPECSVLHYVDTTAHIIEILTEKASNSYKAFLRELGISYIIAGKEELDYSLAMEKLYDLFDIHTLMLGGGGILNWSFIQARMCDEISVVIAAGSN